MAARRTGAWWWIDRWRKSTAYTDMTLAEQGAYRNLLDELWLRGGLLPLDERTLARACGDALEWAAVRDHVLAHFESTPDGYRNRTHDEVAEKSEELSHAQAVKGARRAAAAPRGPAGRFQPDQPDQPDIQPDQPDIQPDIQPAHQPPDPDPDPDLNHRTENARAREPSEPARRQPLQGRGAGVGSFPRDHLKHAFCPWQRVEGSTAPCVHEALHGQLLQQLAGDTDRLDAFYRDVAERTRAPCGDDMFDFWRAHFAAAFPSAAPTKGDASQAQTARKVAEMKRYAEAQR